MDEFNQAFIQEADELLENMENLLLSLESNPQDSEALNGIFRAIHTIKGSAGMFGFKWMVDFTHVLENLLESMRSGLVLANKEIIEGLLISKDYLNQLVQIFTNSTELTKEKIEEGESILSRLKPFLIEQESKLESSSHDKESSEQLISDSPLILSNHFHISLRPGNQVFINALDPYSFIKYLNQLGSIEYIKTITNHIPNWENWNPELCYMGFEILVHSDKSIDEIKKVFEFMEYDSTILILPPFASIEMVVNHIQSLAEDEIYLSNVFHEMGTLNQSELIQVLETIQGKITGFTKINSSPSPIDHKINTKETAKDSNSAHLISSLRVDSNKIDHLINKVGELVVSEANLNMLLQKMEDTTISESLHTVHRLINELREISLKLRMVQVGESFNKYHRILRDLGIDLSKKVQLTIHGGETELDKSVVEKISDPMVHIIRNAVDHGLETSEERILAGKNEVGTVSINAFHDTGSIVIEISDDGRGIDLEKVKKKAIEKGLMSAEDVLSSEEIHKLLFHPGFSTAEKVTNISGRGVGLDVVQKNIQSLRGNIQIQSKPGEWTRFTIRLPLTLAIIDGFLVGSGKEMYVIPLDLVRECIEFQKENENHHYSGNYFNLRGKMLPFARLDFFFHKEERKQERENIVITEYQGNQIGLVVDRLYGEIQTVIKPLAKVFQDVRGIGGSTTLGDGQIALILDIIDLHSALKENDSFYNSQLNSDIVNEEVLLP